MTAWSLKVIFAAAVMRLRNPERFRRAVRSPSCCFVERWLYAVTSASYICINFFLHELQKSQIRVLWAAARTRRLAGGRKSAKRRRRERACSRRSPDGRRPPTRRVDLSFPYANVRRRQAILEEGRGVVGRWSLRPRPGHQYQGPVALQRSSRPGRRSWPKIIQRSLCRE